MVKPKKKLRIIKGVIMTEFEEKVLVNKTRVIRLKARLRERDISVLERIQICRLRDKLNSDIQLAERWLKVCEV